MIINKLTKTINKGLTWGLHGAYKGFIICYGLSGLHDTDPVLTVNDCDGRAGHSNKDSYSFQKVAGRFLGTLQFSTKF